MNRDVERAWQYHNRTKHSFESVRRGNHFLDWANQPVPFKIYPDLEPLPLPRELDPASAPAPALGRAELAHLLYFAAGITKRRQYPGGEMLFRAAACTGALYEIELYVVCGDLRDLPAGVYHFGPGDFALRCLREGDFRGAVAGAPPVPALIISTGTYWRNAWKYQARTYRHFGWDNGTILANLLATAEARRLPARVLVGFVDAEVNRLLGLDTNREVALSIVALGQEGQTPPPSQQVPVIHFETVPLSREEVDYPLMREIHEASSLANVAEVLAWRTDAGPAAPTRDETTTGEPIEEVILRRGSARRFRRDPITQAELTTILERATQGIDADFPTPLNELYLIVNAVEGLFPGAYYYRRAERELELLKPGDFRREAAYLGLEQDLPGDAAAAIFFLADLKKILERLGNRGYRAVHLEAGIAGGRIYLGAYAQHLGATGLTFYDDDVVRFFSPHAEGKSAIFLVAVGHPARRKT